MKMFDVQLPFYADAKSVAKKEDLLTTTMVRVVNVNKQQEGSTRVMIGFRYHCNN
jgi:hypothetical protein